MRPNALTPEFEPDSSGSPLPRELLVVVDDDLHAQKALQRVLERAGYDVLGFRSAADVHRWLEDAQAGSNSGRDRDVAGAVVDVHLPDGDGIELTRRLRDRLGRETPLVVVSGDTSMEVIGRLRDAGADRFVGKPLNLQALLQALGRES